jgi:hypothetical protein
VLNSMLEPNHDGSLRLCIASANYHPVYSGAGLRFRRYAPAFQSRGVQVSVCTAPPTLRGAIVSEAVTALPRPRMGGFSRLSIWMRGSFRCSTACQSPPNVENMPCLLRAADVFVFTSRREDIPNAMLGGMASGLSVVTTPFDGLSGWPWKPRPGVHSERLRSGALRR